MITDPDVTRDGRNRSSSLVTPSRGSVYLHRASVCPLINDSGGGEITAREIPGKETPLVCPALEFTVILYKSKRLKTVYI